MLRGNEATKDEDTLRDQILKISSLTLYEHMPIVLF